jgi:hypothetical protein
MNQTLLGKTLPSTDNNEITIGSGGNNDSSLVVKQNQSSKNLEYNEKLKANEIKTEDQAMKSPKMSGSRNQ